MADPRKLMQASANGQSHLQPRRSAVVLSAGSPVVLPAGSPVMLPSASSTGTPQRSPMPSPLIGTLQSTDGRMRTTSALISQQIAEHSSPAGLATTQPSPIIRASVPPVIRSPVLMGQPSPASVQNQFRNSTTALGTKRWSLISSPCTSPLIQPSAAPLMTSQASQQRSPAVVLRRSVVGMSGTQTLSASPMMTATRSDAVGLPRSNGSSPKIPLLCSPATVLRSPATQTLTPTLPRAQASSASSAAAAASPPAHSAAQACLLAQQTAAATAATDEDDLFFELPPPVVDLEEPQPDTVESEDGSDAGGIDVDAADLTQDASFVRSPCGTRWVKASRKYSLDRSYSIWFQHAQHAKKKPKSEEQYAEGLQSVGTFNSVQDFWRYWNAIDLKKMPNFCSISVFKHPIKPMWEDPHNKEGGQWVIRCDRAQTSDFFTKLALALIGGYFECHEDLCGVVLSMKPKFNSLSLWNCQAEPDLIEPVEQELRELLGLENSDASIEYKNHSGTIGSNSAKKRREVADPASEFAVPGMGGQQLSRLAGSSFVGGMQLAPSWLMRPARPATVISTSAPRATTEALPGADAGTALLAKAESGDSGTSTLKASATVFNPSAAEFDPNGYAGSSSGTDYQYAQGSAANGSQYGNYYGGDYGSYYETGEYSSAAAYYPGSGQNPASNEWT